MTRCDKYLENLSAYLDGELSVDNVKEIEEHSSECESCSEELSVLKTIISALHELEEELPAGFETSLHRRLEEAAAKPGVKIRTGKVRLFAQIAAGFVVVVCLGLAIRAGLMGTGRKTASPAADMSSAQSVIEDRGLGAASGTASTKRAIPEISGRSDGAAYDDRSEMEYYALEDSAENQEVVPADAMVIQKAQVNYDVLIAFSEAEGSYALKQEGQDTLVKITADDAQIALEKIIEIESEINQEEQYSNAAGLNETLNAVEAGIVSGDRIEVKLLYSDDETWNEFLTEVQANFSEVLIEFAPKAEDVEYIRVEIIKQ